MDTQKAAVKPVDMEFVAGSAGVDPVLQVDLVPVTDKTWKRLFALQLMEHGIFAVAAKAIGKRPSEIRKEAATDQAFAEIIQDAMEIAAGSLEHSARKRAIAESDTLMIRLLEASQPERFRRDAPPSGTVFVKAYMGFTPDMWDDNTGKQKVETNPPSEQLTVDDSVTVEGEIVDGTTNSTV